MEPINLNVVIATNNCNCVDYLEFLRSDRVCGWLPVPVASRFNDETNGIQ